MILKVIRDYRQTATNNCCSWKLLECACAISVGMCVHALPTLSSVHVYIYIIIECNFPCLY